MIHFQSEMYQLHPDRYPSYPPKRRLRKSLLTAILIDPHTGFKQPCAVALHEPHHSFLARIRFIQQESRVQGRDATGQQLEQPQMRAVWALYRRLAHITESSAETAVNVLHGASTRRCATPCAALECTVIDSGCVCTRNSRGVISPQKSGSRDAPIFSPQRVGVDNTH